MVMMFHDILLQEKQMIVLVESNVLRDIRNRNEPLFNQYRDKLIPFEPEKNGGSSRASENGLSDNVDLIICLGGDGTLLFASSLFQVKAFLRVQVFGPSSIMQFCP